MGFNIGSVFLTLLADGAKLEADMTKQGAKAAEKAGATMGQRLTASIRKAWSGGAIGQGLVQGLGLAGGLGAVSLLTRGLDALGDVVGDSIKAFNEEQVSVQKLGTALRENIPNWDGNTRAIEDTLKARMKLGFSDDEQRESLALLVAKTNDVTRALEIERAAMDLARLKGIDLAAATRAISMGMSGSGRALKELGINVKDYASETEILTAIQAKAAGQAEDYARTNTGKLLVSQVKVGEAMEKLGAFLAGPQADAMAGLADLVEDLAGNLDGLARAAEIAGVALEELGVAERGAVKEGLDLIHAAQDFMAIMNPTKVSNTVGVFLDAMDNVGIDTRAARYELDQIGKSIDAIGKEAVSTLVPAGHHVEDALVAVGDAAADAKKPIEDVGKAAKTAARDSETAGARLRASWKRTVDYIVGKAQELISDAFDPIIAKDALSADNAEAAAQRKILASKATTREQKAAAREAQTALNSLMQDTAQQLVTLAAAGQTGSAAYKTGLANLKTFAASATGSTRIAISAAIAEIERLEAAARAANPTITVHVKIPRTTYSLSAGPHVVTGSGDLKDWRIYDRGGTVPGPPGSHSLAVLQAGERVLTPAQQNAWGPVENHYNLTVQGNLEAKDEGSVLRTLQRLSAVAQ